MVPTSLLGSSAQPHTRVGIRFWVGSSDCSGKEQALQTGIGRSNQPGTALRTESLLCRMSHRCTEALQPLSLCNKIQLSICCTRPALVLQKFGQQFPLDRLSDRLFLSRSNNLQGKWNLQTSEALAPHRQTLPGTACSLRSRPHQCCSDTIPTRS